MAENSNGNDHEKPDSSNNNSSGDGGKSPQNFFSRAAAGWLLLGGLAVLLLVLMSNASGQHRKITLTKFLHHAKKDDFQGTLVVEDNKARGELKPDTPGTEVKDGEPQLRVYTPLAGESMQTWLTQELVQEHDQDVEPDPSARYWWQFFIAWGPIILIAALIYFFIFRSMRNAGGGAGMLGNFARSKHRVTTKEHSNVRLQDVAGVAEAKDEVTEMIEFLKDPKKFQRLGGRVPRGVLLQGPPGCGKTLLAKAVAGEADVPFFSISGSDFVEMFVGVGASRVRDLFKQAKESSPCIIFLDEIDAVGRKRGSGFASGGHDEREQTLNAILVEMDGFESSDQVIVIAATNRSDVLDPALTRPGRFDRTIDVPYPDIRGRVEMLKVHAQRVKMGPDVDLEVLARGTPMFTGADLAALINEAAISATLQGKECVEHPDLEEARDKVRWGRARTSHKIEEDEKATIAYHEAGHATLTYFDPQAEPLHKVSIIPRGQSMGATFMLPEKDRHLYTRRQLLAQLRVTFGGRLAEAMFCDDISSGAAQDIRQATQIAQAMVTEYGMSERLGFQALSPDGDQAASPLERPEPRLSEDTTRLVDEEVKRFIDQTYAEAQQMLEEHRDALQRLAQALLKHETLTRDEVARVMRGEPLEKPSVSDLLEQERSQSASEAPGGSNASAGPDDEAPPDAVPSPA